jgi:hypothetical protein
MKDKQRFEERPAEQLAIISPMAKYADQFREVFEGLVEAGKNGHTGDIAPRAQPDEP